MFETKVVKFTTGLDKAFNKAFEKTLDNMGFTLGYDAKAKTPCNVYTNDSGSTIEIPMTGIPRENIKLELLGRVLTVTGEVETKSTDKKVQFQKLSRRDVNMTFSLPEGCTAENVTSKLENGLLTIEITNPAKEVATAKAINIEVK